ncbi:MAG: bifunctional phosphopantothenoylcysteine decarboxylase/phosphopantothenate--cysteine ligase CoaBC [Thermaerobacter sp.]|jgi:phosphopantothenoylcysteine decarboxylase/phosphopantothenate--cysteine ligase|nr:bifunctional phosphopantothenoylcysteine decarboxylase/phosphopantothenate--cysteine ligase CoaBC [Thermaerobacter sp.]
MSTPRPGSNDPLAGKTLLVGVGGGIAAYKMAEVTSRLRQRGAAVEVIMTRAARRFVGELTFAALSGRPVRRALFRAGRGGHVDLAARAQGCIVGPATADLIGRLAAGLADDLLTATLLDTRAPVVLAPAMESRMYRQVLVQENLRRLRRAGYHLVEPEEGFLASGERGVGRLPAPERLVEELARLVERGTDLAGLTVLITAGPTREHLDPVRFLSNPSSGRMGYALAAVAHRRGARVVLVSGPVALEPPEGVTLVEVTSARQMREAVLAHLDQAQAVVMSAAVADQRPASFSPRKIKKGAAKGSLELADNPDILAELGERKAGRILVGFAAETGDPQEEAARKLAAKHLDLVVANDVTAPDSGFGSRTNQVWFVTREGTTKLPLLSKEEVAERLLDHLRDLWRTGGDDLGPALP